LCIKKSRRRNALGSFFVYSSNANINEIIDIAPIMNNIPITWSPKILIKNPMKVNIAINIAKRQDINIKFAIKISHLNLMI